MKNFSTLIEGVDNQRLLLLEPTRCIHVFFGHDVDILVLGHQHDRYTLLTEDVGKRREQTGKHGSESHLFFGTLNVDIDNQNGVWFHIIRFRTTTFSAGSPT